MPDQAELAVLKLARLANSWKTIEIIIDDNLITNSSIGLPAGVPFDRIRTRYIETSDGKRRMDIEYFAQDGRTNREEAYCDGTRSSQVLYNKVGSQPEVRIGRTFMDEGVIGGTRRPNCLVFLHVGKVPIDEALPGAKILGTGKVIGRDVDLYLFPRVRWGSVSQDLVYSLDRETSMPMKVESYRTEEDRIQDRPGWSWTVQKLDFIQGRPFAMASEHLSYTIERPKIPRTLSQTHREIVESVAFDGDYQASTFWPKISSEARVIDSIQKKITLPSRPSSQPAVAHVVQPIRVEPARDWTSTISTATLALGGVLIVMSLASWIRRKNA